MRLQETSDNYNNVKLMRGVTLFLRLPYIENSRFDIPVFQTRTASSLRILESSLFRGFWHHRNGGRFAWFIALICLGISEEENEQLISPGGIFHPIAFA